MPVVAAKRNGRWVLVNARTKRVEAQVKKQTKKGADAAARAKNRAIGKRKR